MATTEARESSTPFFKTMMNDLARESWAKAGGDMRVAIKVYFSAIQGIIRKSANIGLEQEARALGAGVKSGAKRAKADTIATVNRMRNDAREYEHQMMEATMKTVAGLNALGAATAIGFNAVQAYESRNREEKANWMSEKRADYDRIGGSKGTGQIFSDWVRPELEEVWGPEERSLSDIAVDVAERGFLGLDKEPPPPEPSISDRYMSEMGDSKLQEPTMLEHQEAPAIQSALSPGKLEYDQVPDPVREVSSIPQFNLSPPEVEGLGSPGDPSGEVLVGDGAKTTTEIMAENVERAKKELEEERDSAELSMTIGEAFSPGWVQELVDGLNLLNPNATRDAAKSRYPSNINALTGSGLWKPSPKNSGGM